MNKQVKIVGLIIGIIMFIAVIAGFTYAASLWVSDKINLGVNSKCFDIYYEKGNDISGSIVPSTDYSGGLFATVKINISNSCDIRAYGKLYLNTEDTTSSNLYREGLLNYQVLKNNIPISSGSGTITSSGTIEINLGELSKASKASTPYTVYVWVNNDLVENTDANSVYSGNINVEVSQFSVPETKNLKDYIRNLYASGTPELITHNKDNGTSDTYYYSYQDEDKTWGLMNDGLKVSSTEGAGATVITDTTSLTSGTEGNIRYFGPSDSVNNYIYFNCSDYNNQTDSTCEKWRIIGIVDGKVKIIRNDSIGNLAWDEENSNNWETSSLQEYLNGQYYNEVLTNATRMNNIVFEAKWYLGGYTFSKGLYPNDIYNYERTNIIGTTVGSGNPYTLDANIGLMYPSDYWYSTDLTKCSTDLSNSENSSACSANNWLYKGVYQWLITSSVTNIWSSWVISAHGELFSNDVAANAGTVGSSKYSVVPVLYLNSQLGIDSYGDGTSGNPYKIYVEKQSPVTIEEHITDLYNSGNPVTINDSTLNTTYYYSESVNLMNDGLDSDGNATGDASVGNIRYYGASPNNYIYFNCDDYTNQTSDTCEVWRIIGIIDGKVKLVRGSYLDRLAWDYDYNDNKSKTTYSADWNESSLENVLNNAYYNNLNYSFDYYSLSVATGEGIISTKINYAESGTGIKNDYTRDMIEESTWYMYSGGENKIYTNAMYKLERTGSDTWTGKIALVNVSDYGYASDLNKCKQTLVNYNDSNCTNYNWLKGVLTNNSNYHGWFINSVNYPWMVGAYNYGITYTSTMNYNNAVLPALYLKPELVLSSVGDGTSTNPYRIKLD